MKKELKKVLDEVKGLKSEIERLEAKLQELKEKEAEEERRFQEAQNELAKLLALEALGELEGGRSEVAEQQKKLSEQELAKKAAFLARQEIERRLEKTKEDLRVALLKLFAIRREQVLEFLKKKFKEYNELAKRLAFTEELINTGLDWLKAWEELLSSDLEMQGLSKNKGLEVLGPLYHRQRLDNPVDYIWGLPKGGFEIKPIRELVAKGKVGLPSWPKGFEFLTFLALSKETRWQVIERALGLTN